MAPPHYRNDFLAAVHGFTDNRSDTACVTQVVHVVIHKKCRSSLHGGWMSHGTRVKAVSKQDNSFPLKGRNQRLRTLTLRAGHAGLLIHKVKSLPFRGVTTCRLLASRPQQFRSHFHHLLLIQTFPRFSFTCRAKNLPTDCWPHVHNTLVRSPFHPLLLIQTFQRFSFIYKVKNLPTDCWPYFHNYLGAIPIPLLLIQTFHRFSYTYKEKSLLDSRPPAWRIIQSVPLYWLVIRRTDRCVNVPQRRQKNAITKHTRESRLLHPAHWPRLDGQTNPCMIFFKLIKCVHRCFQNFPYLQRNELIVPCSVTLDLIIAMDYGWRSCLLARKWPGFDTRSDHLPTCEFSSIIK